MNVKSIIPSISKVFAAALMLSAAPAFAGGQPKHERVEVVFVLDTTGSMADLIDGAKRKIWSIANTIVDNNPDADIAMALVGYRDIGDDYVIRTTPLSDDIQGLYGKLTKLDANGGGDTEESVNAALNEAISKLQWSNGDNVTRIVFLVGDAPPHMDYQEKKYPAILKDAVKRDIIVNAVQAGDMPETTPIWKEIAQRGHGRFMAIPQDGGQVVVIETPYDSEIIILQGKLDETVVPYGEEPMRRELKRKLSDKAMAPASTQVENSKYYAKRSKKEVVTGGGDLVTEFRNNQASMDSMAESAMPDELKPMKPAERKQWVGEKLEARVKLEARMAELVAKRDAFVAQKKAKVAGKVPADSFDAAVEETLQSQLN